MGLSKLKMLWALLCPWIKNQVGCVTPYGFFLNTTTVCNYRCGYCAVASPVANHEIGFVVAMRAINVMHAKGCRYVGLMGGEPLLLGVEKLVAIIRYATGRGMITYLPTNLALLTEGLLDELINGGVTIIDVAIDTVTPKDGLPKSLSLVKGKLGLVLSRREKVIVKLNTTITRMNIPDVRELVELAHKLKVPISVHIVEKFSAMSSRGSLFFSKGDLPEIRKISEWFLRKKREGYWITNPPWYFDKMVEMVGGGHRSGWRCLAGKKTMLIDEYGKFYPCLSLMGVGEYGDIFTGADFSNIDKQVAKCNTTCLSCINALCAEMDSTKALGVYDFIRKFW